MNFKNIKSKYGLISVLILLVSYVRFSYSLPVCWHPDSVKYVVPLQIILAKNLAWIFDSINFSLFTRLINYFIQIANQGDPSGIIIYQKVLGILSSVLFFLIAKKITKGNILWSFIGTIIFSFNPLMLFFEQLVMPESVLIFEAMLLTWLLLKYNETFNSLFAILIGLLLGFMVYTKETASVYAISVISVLIVVGLYKWLKEKNKASIKTSILMLLVFMLSLLPMYLYNYYKFQQFTLNRYTTKGAFLWFLSEEMLLQNPTSKHPWLTYSILSAYNSCKTRFKIPPQQSSRIAFECGVAQVNVAARSNALVNPFTGTLVEQKEWNKTVPEYYLDTLLRNPQFTWDSFLYNAKIMLFVDNFYFYPYRESSRAGTNYEAIMFTQIPFSLKDMFDPKLKNIPVINTNNMDSNNIYSDESKTQTIQGVIPIMVNQDLNQAFLVPEKGLSLWLQRKMLTRPLMPLLLPLFSLALIFFIFQISKWFKDTNFLPILYLAASALMFLILPAFIHGESRYQLQFTHYMLLFVLAVFFSRKTD